MSEVVKMQKLHPHTVVPVDPFNFHYSKESLGVFLLSLIKEDRRLLCEVLCLLNFTHLLYLSKQTP